ncbi:MAG: hypothetical protein ICV85_19875 [Tolypothrix sp. T3-bin4]|nr:hypothetical protein [Tolypothrix sp. T3-bin4]
MNNSTTGSIAISFADAPWAIAFRKCICGNRHQEQHVHIHIGLVVCDHLCPSGIIR